VGSVCFAIITDIFPMEMRGRVMGFVQTAFAACSVLGLPISLALSAHWGWNAPFLLIVAVGTVVGLAIARWLKPVDAHLKLAHDSSPLHHLATTVSNPRYILGFVTTSFVSVGGFMLMPFVSAFNVHNVGVPFTSLPMLYLITGFFAAGVGPLIGRASDAFGKYQVFFFGGVVTIVMVIIYTHMSDKPLWYLIIVSILLQIGIFSRIISGTALTSGLPEPADRGAYMSITSSLQQIAGGIAAVVAGQIVVESATGTLLRFDLLGYTLSVTTVISMGLMYLIARRIRRDSGAPRPASEVVVP
jgi:predicted MFS family arabinose efflux permease